jgi:hypothetical protein
MIMDRLGRAALFVSLCLTCAGALPEKSAAIHDNDALMILRSVLKDRDAAGWDLETRCRFLKGAGFSLEESRFVIETFNVYGKDLDRLDADRQAILAGAGIKASPEQVTALRELDDRRSRQLSSIQRDIGQIRSGALKAKLETMLFLMKRGIQTRPSACQERLARLYTYTAMSETPDGRMTSLGLTVSDAWREHAVRVITVLRGPGESREAKHGEWGAESAVVVTLKAAETGLFVGESEHHESCAGSNLTKLAGSTRGTKYQEAATRAALK